MKNPKYKAVIFDFDDTLVSTHAIKWENHKFVAKKFYNIDLTEDDIRAQWGKPLQILIPELYKHSDTYENMYAAYVSTKNDFPKTIHPGSVEVIDMFLEQGLEVGLLSATNKELLLEDLNRFHFPIDRFSTIQGAEDTLVHKPDPGVFAPVLEKLMKKGHTKDQIVYVGDSIDDLQASHGAGINFIALTTGLYNKEEFRKGGAKVILQDIRDIVKEIL